jgi:hypothetical protein
MQQQPTVICIGRIQGHYFDSLRRVASLFGCCPDSTADWLISQFRFHGASEGSTHSLSPHLNSTREKEVTTEHIFTFYDRSDARLYTVLRVRDGLQRFFFHLNNREKKENMDTHTHNHKRRWNTEEKNVEINKNKIRTKSILYSISRSSWVEQNNRQTIKRFFLFFLCRYNWRDK